MEPARDVGRGWLGAQFANEDELMRERAHTLGVPFTMLTRDTISLDALVLIPEALSRAHSMAAYAWGGDALEVAFVNIDDLQKVQALHPQVKIKARLTNQASIKQALVLYQKHLKDTFGAGLQAGSVEALVRHALLSQASDVHLDVAEEGTRVRYRIAGVLHEAIRLTGNAGSALVQNIKSIAKLFPNALAQSGKFKIEKDNEAVLVSVANIPAVNGEKITMRLVPEYAGTMEGHRGFTLEALGLRGKGLEQVHALLHARSGLVLVAGTNSGPTTPLGAGKTTTLYTLLDHIRGTHVAVATVEDVIEYRLPHATQTQTRPELGLSMLAGLRAVLRTDPDVVMVGNIENADVALAALEAASRGVLVFAAIEAKSAAGAIEKLISWGLPPQLVASSLRGVIGQALVSKLGSDKKDESKLTREEGAQLEGVTNFARVLAALKDEGQVQSHVVWKDVPFYREAEGEGLIGLQEVLQISPIIKDMIVEQSDLEELTGQARKEGMLTLAEDALFKAAEGLVSIDKVLEIAGE